MNNWLKKLFSIETKTPVLEPPKPEYGAILCVSCDKWNRFELKTLFEFTSEPLMYKVPCLHCGDDIVYDPPPPKPKPKTSITMEDLRLNIKEEK